jgi:hypothetical protein
MHFKLFVLCCKPYLSYKQKAAQQVHKIIEKINVISIANEYVINR